MMNQKYRLFFIKSLAGLLACALLLAGCSAAAPSAAPEHVAAAALTPTAPGVEVVLSPTTASPPLMTATPEPAFTTTAAPTPTPTPHPMTIAALRAQEYPGSDIVLEQELEPGANYRRFYASYLSDGYKIYALLTIPNGEMPPGGFPAIVFNHGYIPPDVYVTTERYIAYVDNLARAGYIVFRIDYRGHDRSEGPASGAYGSPGYLTDVLNALASIKKFPQANPAKIGMWGHSMGGYLTLRAMVISKDIKAGVIWAGVVGSYPDMLYNWRRRTGVPTPVSPTSPSSAGRGWRTQWIDAYGTPEENPEFWGSVSANTYLSELSGPLQLHHGTADTDVPVAFSETLSAQIQAAGKLVELYTYPEDNHNISNYFVSAMANTIAFYGRYLK